MRAFDLAEAHGNWGDLASTKKQCRALCLKLHGQRGKFDDCFPVRTVAVVTGHMIDDAQRSEARFPADREGSVVERMQSWIRTEQVRVSFSSAAAGADLLWVEVAQAAGVETHLVLPIAEEEFVACRVRPWGEAWVERFGRAVARAASVTVLNEGGSGTDASLFSFCASMIAAKAAPSGPPPNGSWSFQVPREVSAEEG